MKNKIVYILAAVSLLFGSSSCGDFGDVNNDPQHVTGDKMKFEMMFTGAQVFVAGRDWAAWRNNLIYCSTMMQHLSSTQGYWAGDKYTYNSGYNAAYFDSYDSGIKTLMETYFAWKDDETRVNEFQMTRIVRVILMHRMTDMYGDVPYSEAGQGYISGIKYPKYDTQQSIYADMLKELDEAAQTLDATKPNNIKSADIMYQGDVDRWKKTAYSLMLRLGMRLSKVDPAEAQKWVKKAVDGGLYTGNADNAIIKHDATTDDAADASGKVLCYLDPDASRVSQTFIDHLRNSKDPRLTYIATVCENPKYGALDPKFEYGDTTAVKQLGMPNGYDQLGKNSLTDISKAPNWPGDDTAPDPDHPGEVIVTRSGMTKYSVVNRYTYARLDAPTFVITHAENLLLMAEAAYRGWISGSAKDYYESGVKAAMDQFADYGVRGITSDQISRYLANNPYNGADALNQINTQYWVVTFVDEYESWANWRRSGYPVLKQVDYYGNATNGTIPRRFTYATSEANINAANYQAPVANLVGGDKMTSRVWWDK